jgi:hypothetical protein
VLTAGKHSEKKSKIKLEKTEKKSKIKLKRK